MKETTAIIAAVAVLVLLFLHHRQTAAPAPGSGPVLTATP